MKTYLLIITFLLNAESSAFSTSLLTCLHKLADDAPQRFQHSSSQLLDQLRSIGPNSTDPKTVKNLLSEHLDSGEKLFLKNGKFIFSKGSVSKLKTFGENNSGLYRVKTEAGNLIIKDISESSEILQLEEILNAKIIEQLGLGPKAEIVKQSKRTFMIMEEAKGINVKDLLSKTDPEGRIQSQLEKALNRKFESFEEASKYAANLFLENPHYQKRILEIKNKLISSGYKELNDFQFMIDFSNPQDSLQVIDAGLFNVKPNGPMEDPASAISTLMGNLRGVRGYIEPPKKRSFPFFRRSSQQ